MGAASPQTLNQPLDELSAPVVAIDGVYCARTRVTLRINDEPSLSHRDLAVHDTTTDQLLLRVDAKKFSSHKTLVDANDVAVAFLREDVFSFRWAKFIVFADVEETRPLVRLRAKYSMFRATVEASFRDARTGQQWRLEVERDWRLHIATVWLQPENGSGNNNRKMVARIYRPHATGRSVLLGTQDYCVDVARHVDSALIALVCVAFMEARKDFQQRRLRRKLVFGF